MTTFESPNRRRRGLQGAVAWLAAVAGLCFGATGAYAVDAVWTGAAGDGNFNTPGNWATSSVPTGQAQFVLSVGPTNVTINQPNILGEFLFGGTSAPSITINGVAVGVNSGIVAGTFYAPTFIINGGGSLNAGGSLANANITVNSASSTNPITSLGLIGADGGTATITNNSLVILNGTSVLAGATVTNNGAIPIIGLLPKGFAGSATLFEDTSTGGNARLINNATGTFDFSDTTGPGGGHQVGAGSIEGGGQIFLGANTLTVGGNNLSTVFSGAISDCAGNACLLVQIGGATPSGGSLIKDGSGTLTLTGVNTYTGFTQVNAGTLEVDGSIANTSAVYVASGGTLSGTGVVDPVTTTVMSGGTLTPGNAANPTGTLTITGNLAFQSGALYLVRVMPTAASATTVSGTASLAGTVQASFASGGYLSKQYDILRSAGLNGSSFAALTTSNLPAGFSASLSYSATDVFLNISGSGLAATSSLNINQQNVSTALSNFFNAGGALPPQFAAVNGLTGGNLGGALTQLSGETATGAQQTTYDAMGLFMGLLTDHAADCRSPARRNDPPWDNSCPDTAKRPADSYALFTKAPLANVHEPHWSVWGAGFGGSRSTDGSAQLGSNNATGSVYGAATGADYLFSPTTLAGFALAGGGTSFSVANGGSGRSDLFQAGAYVRHSNGPAYISAALAYGWQDITTNRTVTVAGIDQLQARFDANAWSGRIEGGYRIVPTQTGGIGITPYAAAQFTTLDLPAYTESAMSGASTFALAYGAKQATDPRSELGIRADKSVALEDGVFTLRGRLAWAHDCDPSRAIAATFEALPGATFVVNGAAQAADSALTTASAQMVWRNGWSATAAFEGEFSGVTRSYAGKGMLRYTW